MSFKVIVSASVALGAMVTSSSVQAQVTSSQSSPDATAQQEDSGLQDIVVTAQRRAQSMQDVPIAVSAVTGSMAAARGLTDVTALSGAIPALNIVSVGVGANTFIRGIGTNAAAVNSEQSVAMYIDGVYIYSYAGNVFPFNNLERIEVLKGPQGTLFGRNATAGVIQYITRDPSQELSGNGSVGYANYDTISATGYLTGGIASNLAADVAVYYENQRDGWGRNERLGIDTFTHRDFAVRSKVLFTPSEDTEVRATFSYGSGRNTGTNYQIIPGLATLDGSIAAAGPYDQDTNFEPSSTYKSYLTSLRIDQDFGAFRFVSISAYRDVKALYIHDQDSTALPIVDATVHQPSHNVSQEFQILSPKSSKVQWLLGAYYFNASAEFAPITIAGLAAAPNPSFDIFAHQKTESFAGFGQATAEIVPRTNLTLGLRWTTEKQRLNNSFAAGGNVLIAPPTQNQQYDRLTWRISLDHKFTDHTLGYISYNRGVKSGGYNLASFAVPGFQPESVDAYEVGLKTELFDRHLRINTSAFWYEFKDIQVQLERLGGTNIVNGAKARVKGFDFDFEAALTSNFSLTGGGSYIHGRYIDFKDALAYPASPLDGPSTNIDATGNRTVYAPKFSGNIGVTQTIPMSSGNISLNALLIYNSSAFVQPTNRLKLPSYTRVNASVGWSAPDDRLGVKIWGRNLFNQEYYTSRLETGFGDQQIRAAPRTYGATLSAKF